MSKKDKTGTSETKTGFWGNKYEEHRDNDGNVTGTSRKQTGFFGNKYEEHRDTNKNVTGTSRKQTGFFGNKYEEHRDTNKNVTGTSEKQTGFFGNKYEEHRDTNKNVTGTSEKQTGFFGNKYEEHRDTNKSGCFITTACIQEQGLSDDCYELQVLRKYRDSYLKSTKDGKSLVNRYYDFAPRLVTLINKKSESKLIYEKLYRDLVQPCVTLVEQSKFSEAQALYLQTVEQLFKEHLSDK